MEKQLSNQESLALITQMINQSKQNVRRGSFYFLIWGWVVILGNLSHYSLMMFTEYPYPYLVWLISIPTSIVCGIYGSRQSKGAIVRTHIDRMYATIWIAFTVPLVVIIFGGSVIGEQNITGMIMLTAGYAVFVSGKLLKFTPTVYGGVVLWVTGILALYFNDANQYLIAAVGVALGYLVPGYMMKRKENNA